MRNGPAGVISPSADTIEVRIRAEGRAGALPPAEDSCLHVGKEDIKATSFTAAGENADTENKREGVLVFKSDLFKGLDSPIHFSFGGGGFERIVLVSPAQAKVVTATVDVEHATSRQMRIDHGSKEVNMANSGPKILVSAESTRDGVLRWKVANEGNGAVEFGAVSEKFKSNDSGLHKHGTVGICSSATSGSCLTSVPMSNGEWVEVIVDAANGTFGECPFLLIAERPSGTRTSAISPVCTFIHALKL